MQAYMLVDLFCFLLPFTPNDFLFVGHHIMTASYMTSSVVRIHCSACPSRCHRKCCSSASSTRRHQSSVCLLHGFSIKRTGQVHPHCVSSDQYSVHGTMLSLKRHRNLRARSNTAPVCP